MLRMGTCMSSCWEPIAVLFGARGSIAAGRLATRWQSTVASADPLVEPRKVATALTLQRLESVKNVRDLAEACAYIKPGMVLRSACPNNATPGDIEILRNDLNVQQLVDLRSEVERREDAADCALLKDVEVTDLAQRGRLASFETYREAADYPVEGSARGLPHAHGGVQEQQRRATLTVHHVALLEKRRYFRSLLTRLPRGVAAYALLFSMFNMDKVKRIVIKEVNHGGLAQLYEILLDSAAVEICTALRIITAAVERGETTMFFCKIGKDRTGLMAALVLAACGASRQEIISDYARSDGADGVAIALGGMEHEVLKDLDVVAFSRAPPEAMIACLDYIDLAYGGTESYLDNIGFTEKERHRLRAALADGDVAPEFQSTKRQNGP